MMVLSSSCPWSADLLFSSSRGEEKTALLLQYVLDCLRKIFLYDSHGFLSAERADALTGPLLDQVRSRLRLPPAATSSLCCR